MTPAPDLAHRSDHAPGGIGHRAAGLLAGRTPRALLITADLFVGLTGFGGGVAVATGVDPFPAEWLAGTPFRSYLVPGVVLAGTVGGSALAAALLMLVRSALGPRASVVAGAVLAGWIVGEVLILHQPTAPTLTEVVYFALGVLMALLGAALSRRTARRLP